MNETSEKHLGKGNVRLQWSDRYSIPAVTVVKKALAKLPKTADGVARSLRQRKITGRPYLRECPIAVYLNRALATAGFRHYSVRVGRWIDIYDAYNHRLPASVDIAVTISNFIADFDNGKYNYLLAP